MDIFRKTLRKAKLEARFDFNILAKKSEGYSASTISNVCSAAMAIPVRESLASLKDICDEDGFGLESVGKTPTMELNETIRDLKTNDVEWILRSAHSNFWPSMYENTIEGSRSSQTPSVESNKQTNSGDEDDMSQFYDDRDYDDEDDSDLDID